MREETLRSVVLVLAASWLCCAGKDRSELDATDAAADTSADVAIDVAIGRDAADTSAVAAIDVESGWDATADTSADVAIDVEISRDADVVDNAAACSSSRAVPACSRVEPQAVIRVSGAGTRVSVTADSQGPCQYSCTTNCQSITVSAGNGDRGQSCTVVWSLSGEGNRSQRGSTWLVITDNPSPTYTCCETPSGPSWVISDGTVMTPASVVLDFWGDGGVSLERG